MQQVTGLVIEGIPGTGKSTLIHHLSRHPTISNREFMTFLTYGEEITQRVLEKKHNQGQISKQDNLNLLREIIDPLENYRDYYQQRWSSSAGYKFAFILERFHLTHTTYFEHLDWSDVIEFDRKLARLNTKVCLLTLSRSVMKDRIIYRRGEEWRNYISRFGTTEEEIIDYYWQVQQQKKKLAAKSKLPVFTVNTSQISERKAVEKVINFWNI